MKDLIIGFASNYEYDQLKYWVNSIKMSGFDGDVVIVSDNIKQKTIDALTAAGVELVVYGKRNIDGDFIAQQSIAPHVNRFFYLWNALNQTKTNYRHVITTDTRDVIFQKNPSLWLDNGLLMHSLLASSEGLRYEDEPWGSKNLLETFGPFYHQLIKERLIYNVGVLAGDQDHIKGFLSLIFQLSINRPIPIVDQAVYNYLLGTEPFDKDTRFVDNADAWAIQLGTTRHAVESGAGDLGKMFSESPDKYDVLYRDEQPTIEDGCVLTLSGTPFTVVHQYDRVPKLKTMIENFYGVNDATESRTIFHHPV